MLGVGEVLPVYRVEHGGMVSMQGNVTVGCRVMLPETGALSSDNYGAFQQAWVKATRVLPANCVLHKADKLVKGVYEADFEKAGDSVLGRASERLFNERHYLDHESLVYLTQLPSGWKSCRRQFIPISCGSP